jgi:hypothetical protein
MPSSTAHHRSARRSSTMTGSRHRRLRAAKGLAVGAVGVVAALPLGLALATAAGPSGPAGAQVTTSQTFGYDGTTSQTFTVPPGVTQVEIAASGGQGGEGAAYSTYQETVSPGGAGGEVSGAQVAVTPGEQLSVDVGGAGGNGSSSSTTAGAGGLTGANGAATLDGGAGGTGLSSAANASGGGGGGSEVLDGDVVLAAAGGGGGSGGSGSPGDGLNGGAGGAGNQVTDPGNSGDGSVATGAGGGAGGSFASNYSPVGGTGAPGTYDTAGGGAGGGGGGGYLNVTDGNDYPGGGLGGNAGSDGFGGGGGGGGGGDDYVNPEANGSITYGANTSGSGSVTISWSPSDELAVTSSTGAEPVTIGEPVTYTATVTTSGGTPDGTVTFFDDNGTVAGCKEIAVSASGDSGTATCTETYTATGTHTINATYGGDQSFPTITDAPSLTQQASAPQVSLAPLTPVTGAVATGAPISYLATVTINGSTVNGAISFSEDGDPVKSCQGLTPEESTSTATTVSGIVRCEVTFSATGSHALAASWTNGGATPTSSAPLSQQVVAPATLYVTTSGSDTSGGSGNTTCAKSSPCATVSHAVSEALAGDTVDVGTGTFSGAVSASLPLTIDGSGPGTVIQPATVQGEGIGLELGYGGTIENLAVDGPAATTTGLSETLDLVAVDQALTNATTTVSHVELSGGTLGILGATDHLDVVDSTISGAVLGVDQETQGSLTLEQTSVTGSLLAGVESGLDEGPPTSSSGPSQLALIDSSVTGSQNSEPTNSLSGFGVIVADGGASLDGSTISGNAGGGIVVNSAGAPGSPSTTGSVTDSTVADNGGPGLTLSGGDDNAAVSVVHATVTGNAGPGLAVTDNTFAWVAGTILAANAGGDCNVTTTGSPVNGGTIVDAGYNLADDDTCSSLTLADFTSAAGDVVGVAPDLGSLADNGGPTETEAPATTSPALGAIPEGTETIVNGTAVDLCGGTDQRGVERPGRSGANCDIGAVELAPSTTKLSSSPARPIAGQSVTLTATVAGDASANASSPTLPTPVGAVSFTDGATALTGCQDVAVGTSGKASCTTTLPTGKATLAATYAGTNGYLASSTTTILTVAKKLGITTATLPVGKVGSPYKAKLAATGGTSPDTWSITGGTLPRGLKLHPKTGKVTGTPKAAGSHKLHVEVTDSGKPTPQRAMVTLKLRVKA